MERREVINLLREILEACHGNLNLDMIDARPPLYGKSTSESTVDELCLKVSLTKSSRALVRRIIAKRGLQMLQNGDFIRIYRDMDQQLAASP